MDASVLLVAFASFLGGLLVTSRVIAWIAGLALLFKPPKTPGTRHGAGLMIAPLLLHSGPWILAVAVAAVFYAAACRTAYLWAVISGLALALSLVGAATLRVFLSQRKPKLEPPPLTPERLLTLRRRFFWLSSLFFAFCTPAVLAFQLPLSYSHDFGFLLFIFLLSFLGGWVWSWFMWQFYGSALQANENRRKKERERQSAV